MENRIAVLKDEFEKIYGCEAELICQAPGRVDLMGSHTDYNQGFVLTLAIDQTILIAGRKRDDGVVHLKSLNVGEADEFDVVRPVAKASKAGTSWTNFVRGMFDVMLGAGFGLSGFDLLFESDIPLGSGVSSSAALEVAVGVFLNEAERLGLETIEIPKFAQKVENEFIGVQSGIMDQYSSAFGKEGHAILLDCEQLTHNEAKVSKDISIVVCNTNMARELKGSEYNDRRADCEAGVEILRGFDSSISSLRDVSLNFYLAHEWALTEQIARRCRFILEENVRVLSVAEAIGKKDENRIRELMLDSFQGSQELFEISVTATDAMMMAMMKASGFIGGRIAGAGFGGCLVAIVDRSETTDFLAETGKLYGELMNVEASFAVVNPSAGAGVVWKK